MHRRSIIFGFCTLVFTSSPAWASYMDDIGATKLGLEFNGSPPNGSGVPVTQIEANAPDPNDYFPYIYEADGTTKTAEFSGKTITAKTPSPNGSTHATSVAQFFYGNDSSVSPGITSVNVFDADNWLADEFLNTGNTSALPDSTTDRVANHSYAGAFTYADGSIDYPDTLDALHRLDYLIQHDDYINVVAVNNAGGGAAALLAGSFNAISVGLTNGMGASGTTDMQDPAGLYVAGRAAPDVVAPGQLTSYATPIVSSTAALLVGYASGLSGPSYVSPRTGITIKYGATNDVIKAAIMAGADRVTMNQSTPDQVSYYGLAADRTSNGLDTRYGAGQVDVYNSYHIIAAGLQGPGTISTYGYDYEPAAGHGTQDYTFQGHYGVAATLAWNIHVDDSMTATLAHFNLYLYDMTAGGMLIASSASTSDNTQNIYFNGLQSSDTYELEVTRAASDPNVTWDYGLAWDLEPAPEPGSAAILLVGTLALARRRRR